MVPSLLEVELLLGADQQILKIGIACRAKFGLASQKAHGPMGPMPPIYIFICFYINIYIYSHIFTYFT